MIPPARNEKIPTPELLAGVAVEIEADEDVTVRPCQPPQAVADSESNGVATPTVNQLAGVYLHVEAPEDFVEMVTLCGNGDTVFKLLKP